MNELNEEKRKEEIMIKNTKEQKKELLNAMKICYKNDFLTIPSKKIMLELIMEDE